MGTCVIASEGWTPLPSPKVRHTFEQKIQLTISIIWMVKLMHNELFVPLNHLN